MYRLDFCLMFGLNIQPPIVKFNALRNSYDINKTEMHQRMNLLTHHRIKSDTKMNLKGI